MSNMVTTKTAMGEEQFKLYQEKEYPNPQSIPRPPSVYEPKPQVALADLTAKSYVKTVGRAVYLKTTERQDELGMTRYNLSMLDTMKRMQHFTTMNPLCCRISLIT